MTAFLVGQRSQLPTYDRRTGSYRASNGKFIGRATILRLVDEESDRLSTRLKAHTRLLTSNSIDLPEWQQRMAEDIKLSGIRMGVFASGGRSQTSSAVYGTVGRELREQYKYLANFAQDLAAGKLSKQQAIARAGMYGGSARVAFHQAQKVTRKREGFVEAKRSLDPGAIHCASCLLYDTQGQWLPVEQVTMPTINCQCMFRCRCAVFFRRRV